MGEEKKEGPRKNEIYSARMKIRKRRKKIQTEIKKERQKERQIEREKERERETDRKKERRIPRTRSAVRIWTWKFARKVKDTKKPSLIINRKVRPRLRCYFRQDVSFHSILLRAKGKEKLILWFRIRASSIITLFHTFLIFPFFSEFPHFRTSNWIIV